MKVLIAIAVQLPFEMDHYRVRGNTGRAKIKYITIVASGAWCWYLFIRQNHKFPT
jgi:hypothetical protein